MISGRFLKYFIIKTHKSLPFGSCRIAQVVCFPPTNFDAKHYVKVYTSAFDEGTQNCSGEDAKEHVQALGLSQHPCASSASSQLTRASPAQLYRLICSVQPFLYLTKNTVKNKHLTCVLQSPNLCCSQQLRCGWKVNAILQTAHGAGATT